MHAVAVPRCAGVAELYDSEISETALARHVRDMGETWARHGRDHCANAQIWRSGRLRRCKYMQGMVVTTTDHCAKRSLKFGAVVGVGAVVGGLANWPGWPSRSGNRIAGDKKGSGVDHFAGEVSTPDPFDFP